MGKLVSRWSIFGIAFVVSAAANAADLPAPVIEHIPHVPEVAAAGGFYLRGDIGYKVYEDPSGVFPDPGTGTLRFERESMDSAWMVGVGAGYRFTKHLRTDVTLDYETQAQAKGYAVCGACTGGFSTEATDIDVWTLMLNGYIDIGTWHKITPYVGGGIGAAYVRTDNTYSINPGGAGRYDYDGSNAQWNFAWALMAGASYAVTPNWEIDAGYRYKNLGAAKTVKLHNAGTGNTRVEWDDLTAHEFRLGARYNFNTAAAPVHYADYPISSNF